jgi:hypothetical protein
MNRNVAICRKCGDFLESVHVHHFVTCKCGAISIDGGHDYGRYVGNPEDFLQPTEADIAEWDSIPTGLLEDWRINEHPSGFTITGKIYQDKLKRFEDGETVRTSVVLSLVIFPGITIRTKGGSTYALGQQRSRLRKTIGGDN